MRDALEIRVVPLSPYLPLNSKEGLILLFKVKIRNINYVSSNYCNIYYTFSIRTMTNIKKGWLPCQFTLRNMQTTTQP
jgi:hypothetical protein